MIGMPKTIINFVKEAEETQKLILRRSVAILLKANSTKVYSFRRYDDCLETLKKDKVTLTKDGEKALEYVFMGGIYRPYKVFIAFCNNPESITTDLQPLEACQFDWFCAPEFSAKNTEIVKWIKMLNEERKLEVKGVVANTKADSEYIVNFTTKKIMVRKKDKVEEVTTDIFTARIASALAGVPLIRAITHFEFEDVVSVERLSNSEYDSKINDGELLLFNDWDKVRVARGVTSLTTTENKSQELRKIIVVEKMHMWSKEVKRIINDNYKGQYQNTYDNKMLLVTDIKMYNDELVKRGVILEKSNKNSIDIDVKAQKKYLAEERDLDVDLMTEEQIRKEYTFTHVFLIANLKFTDAMEDFNVTCVF